MPEVQIQSLLLREGADAEREEEAERFPPFLILSCYNLSSMDKELIFIRHGRQTTKDCNLDVPLSDVGRRQAELLGRRLEKETFDCIYTSDFIRAQETTEIINRHLGLPVMTRPGLREIDWGILTGLSPAELYEKYEHMEDRFLCLEDYTNPGGESGQDVFDRVKPVIDEMVRSDAKRILVVTHGGTIRAIICGLLGIPMRFRLAFGVTIDNTSLTEFLYNSKLDHFSLERFNDYSHLLSDPALLKKNWGK